MKALFKQEVSGRRAGSTPESDDRRPGPQQASASGYSSARATRNPGRNGQYPQPAREMSAPSARLFCGMPQQIACHASRSAPVTFEFSHNSTGTGIRRRRSGRLGVEPARQHTNQPNHPDGARRGIVSLRRRGRSAVPERLQPCATNCAGGATRETRPRAVFRKELRRASLRPAPSLKR
jgi:hypothetical protein